MTHSPDGFAVHLVSDSTGETLSAIARASVAQFADLHPAYHRWTMVRTLPHVNRVLEGIRARPSMVLSSVMEQDVREALAAGCAQMGVTHVSVLDPVIGALQSELGRQATSRPGAQYVMDEAYFQRIDAMHYVIAHDDGQSAAGLAEADVVLVGVSRTSKTPTCIYLANRGVKAANVPLVPGIDPPAELLALNRPVIGLTVNPMVLAEVRRHRLRHLVRTGTDISAVGWGVAYTDPETIREEVLNARRLCQQNNWPVIDVSHRSIEETAASVMDLLERRRIR